MVIAALSRVRAFLLAVLLTACSGSHPPDPPGQPSPDAGSEDAGVDAGPEQPDAGPEQPDAGSCIDDDPCTAERFDESGRCTFPPVPDGTLCDDRDHCTAGDRCVSGKCSGAPSSRPPATYGTLWSYGAAPAEGGRPPLEGLAEFVSDDRILFGERLDGSHLLISLIRTTPTGVQRMSQRILDLRVERYFGSWDWSDRFLTFFVPLGPERVVAVGTRQRLELLGLEGDQLTSLSQLALAPNSDSVLAGAGQGNRFWTCAGYWVSGYRVDANNALVADPQQTFQLSGGPCRSMALSADGRTLWVATALGLVPVDVSAPTGPVVVKPALFSKQAFFHVQATPTHLVVQELLRYGELGRILVFRTEDLNGTTDPAPVKAFSPVTQGNVWERPVGFVLYDGGLLVEWFRYNGTRRVYVADYHALTPEGVSSTLSTLSLRESEEVGLHLSPLLLTGRGRHAVLQPWRRVVEISESGSAMHLRTGLHHGSLERVWASADGSLLTTGPFETHRVDATTPHAPVLSKGGMLLPASTQRLRLVSSPSAPEAVELMTVPTFQANVHQEEGTALLSCLRPGAEGLLEEQGQVRVAGGPGALATAGGRLFQVVPLKEHSYRVRQFTVPGSCTGAVLAPALDRVVQVRSSGETPTGWAFAVDAERSELLLGEIHYADPSLPAKMPLSWFSWPGTSSASHGELSGSTDQFTALALAKGRALVIENRQQVRVLEREGTQIRVQAHVDLSQGSSPAEVSQILSFDGKVAYLALSSQPTGVLVLRADDLSELARYETAGPVRSVAFWNERLILGMNSALTVAEPVCAGP